MGPLAFPVKMKDKNFLEFKGTENGGLHIVKIPLDDGSLTGSVTATSNFMPDHVIVYNSDKVTQKQVYEYHHEHFYKPFLVDLRVRLAKMSNIEWEPGMKVPAELRSLTIHDGEGEIINMLMEKLEKMTVEELEEFLVTPI